MNVVRSLVVLAGLAALAASVPAVAQTKKAPAAPVDEKNLPEVVAKVNGVDIKRTDLQNAVETVKMQFEAIGQPLPMDKKDEMWRSILDEIIGSELLVQEAQNKKIAVTEAEVETELTNFRSRFPSEAVFQNVIKEQGLTEKQLRDEIRKNYGVSKMIKTQILAKIVVDEKAAKKFFDENPEQFAEPEAVRAAHVLVKVDKGADEKAKAEARKEAEKVLADAKAGKDFAALAKAHSDDPGSKDRGGDLDFFTKGQMVEPFEKAVFALSKPGDLSGVVETVYGFHVIKLTEKRAARTIPFAEVKDDLIDFLKKKKESEEVRAYVDALRKKAKVQIFI